MSIILKGIDLPTEGEVKVIDMYGDGSIFVDNGTEYKMYPQAIQIPKGARLIDANKVMEDMRDAMCMTGYQARAMDVIEFAPTILESEVMPK